MPNGSKVKTSNVEGLITPKNPYSRVATVTGFERLVVTAGQLGADLSPEAGGRVKEGFGAQVRQALANLRTVLESEGMGIEDIMALSHYVVGQQDQDVLNQARREFLGDVRPASTLLVVSGLANPAALYEVQAIAAR